jgi:hypothetical protein
MRQTLQVDVLTTEEATVVEVQGTTYAETYQGNLKANGYAKKHPNDEHDAEVGHALAMARALKELAESYEKRAWERINHPRTYTYAYGGVVPDAAGLKKIAREFTLKGNLIDPSWTVG